MSRETVGNESRAGDLNVSGAITSGAIHNPTITGVLSVPDGSAAAPAITNTGDTNTGIAFPDADTVAISTGGSERLRVNASGQVGIGVSPSFQLETYSATSNILMVRGDAGVQAFLRRGSTDVTSAEVVFNKSRGSNASPTVVSSGDSLGQIVFRGHDGSVFQSAAVIQCIVDAGAGAGDMPGRLSFQTSADGAASPIERMRIDSNGLITGTGTSLGAWTAYTPTLAGTGWAIGNGTITGAYCQIGKVVVMRVEITFGSTSTFDATNAPTISLPVTAGTGMAQVGTFVTHAFDLSAAAWYLIHARGANATTVTLQSLGVAGLLANVTSTSPFTWATSDVIRLSGVYQAA